MKGRIWRSLMGISAAAILATALCVTLVFYAQSLSNARATLRAQAALLCASGLLQTDAPATEAERLKPLCELEALRVTWLDADGTVLYDSAADASQMENHLQRPEILAALESGEGESTRASATLGRETVYYALALENGTVLRVSTEVRSVLGAFAAALPLIALIALAIAALCALAAALLTRRLLAPIHALAENIGDASRRPVYKELQPFVEAVRTQHENILAAAQSRQDFTANVTHELKTPLMAISGYAELLENGMVVGEQALEFAGEIRQNAQRMNAMVSDIIRLSELDRAEDLRDSFVPVDLYAAAQKVCKLLAPEALKREIRLSLDGGSVSVLANPDMIDELMENLCQNAIRYNHDGGEVRIFAGMEENHPVFRVADTGVGIPKEFQERVFERFFRVDKSRSRQTGGTGLGLAIVKHIVELHNASLHMQSEVGKGTDIRIQF
ncbi:MAG: ATP-binding protein [Firmicutes bacterium]|nr:ATP-binding protein [Bacillota bacterium]